MQITECKVDKACKLDAVIISDVSSFFGDYQVDDNIDVNLKVCRKAERIVKSGVSMPQTERAAPLKSRIKN